MLAAWPRILSTELERCENEGWTKKPDKGKIKDAYEDGAKMISNLFIHHPHILRPAYRDHRGLWVENKIVINLDGVEIVGYLDMVLPDLEIPGNVIVYDFKTGRHLPEEHNDETVSTYKDQMDLYALACRFYGLKVSRMILVFPRLGKEVIYQPSLHGFNRQRDRAVKVAGYIKHYEKMIELGTKHEDAYDVAFPFVPHPTRCHWCAFKAGCAGPELLEEREQQRVKIIRDSLRTMNKSGSI